MAIVRQRKVHARMYPVERLVCGQRYKGATVTSDPGRVTCGTCLRRIAERPEYFQTRTKDDEGKVS